jgi:hypothetical protein
LLEKADEDTGDYAEVVHPKQRKWEQKQQNTRRPAANNKWNRNKQGPKGTKRKMGAGATKQSNSSKFNSKKKKF